MFNHFILAMHRDAEGKEHFKRYGIHETEALEEVLDSCEFFAHCISEDVLDYVLTTGKVVENFELKEYLKLDDTLFRCKKPFGVNMEKYFISMIIEVNNVQTLHELGKEMIEFVKRTEGIFGRGADEENASLISWLIDNSKETIEDYAYYIYD